MKSAVTSVLTAADAAGRFPSLSDIESVKESLKRSNVRMEAAEKLATALTRIVNNAVDYIYKNDVYLQANKDKCTRDINHYLRLINYCLVTGGTGPLDDWGITGMREVIRIQKLPTSAYVEALVYIRDKENLLELMGNDAVEEIKILINYLINALA
tara:strand:+ start:712 stop:1179 length:468 start_codon:yes stop_codon:yes gene_type:complete